MLPTPGRHQLAQSIIGSIVSIVLIRAFHSGPTATVNRHHCCYHTSSIWPRFGRYPPPSPTPPTHTDGGVDRLNDRGNNCTSCVSHLLPDTLLACVQSTDDTEITPKIWRGRLVSYLVSWSFEPSQPQGITSGLNTNFTLSPSYSFHKSSYHKSYCCFLFSLFRFRRHSTREPASGRATYFILPAYTGTMCKPQLTQEEAGEVLEKKCT